MEPKDYTVFIVRAKEQAISARSFEEAAQIYADAIASGDLVEFEVEESSDVDSPPTVVQVSAKG